MFLSKLVLNSFRLCGCANSTSVRLKENAPQWALSSADATKSLVSEKVLRSVVCLNHNTQVEQWELLESLGTQIDFCDVTMPETGGRETMVAEALQEHNGPLIIPLIRSN